MNKRSRKPRLQNQGNRKSWMRSSRGSWCGEIKILSKDIWNHLLARNRSAMRMKEMAKWVWRNSRRRYWNRSRTIPSVSETWLIRSWKIHVSSWQSRSRLPTSRMGWRTRCTVSSPIYGMRTSKESEELAVRGQSNKVSSIWRPWRILQANLGKSTRVSLELVRT